MIDGLELNYGYLFENELLKEIDQVGIHKKVREGSKIIDVGDYLVSIPLILSGSIKILRRDSHGDDLILYFIEKGDTCAMTMSCCLGQKKSEILAIAESDSNLIMIPISKMESWMSKYKSWQNFVLQSYHSRMTELLEAVDSIAFLKLDDRLLKYLRDKAMVNNNDVMHITHQEIANDLHTSRVVISRLLKSLEKANMIILSRNSIKLLSL